MTLLAALLLPARGVQAVPARDFSVQAAIPENQIDRDQTYFDLYMEPGRQQILQLTIDNSGAADIRARVSLNAASTGRNGTVLYNTAGASDPSMECSIADIARVLDPEVTVPAKGSATARIRVEMPPDQLLDGILLGGVVVTADTVQTASEEVAPVSGVSLETAYEYVVGLQITQTDSPVRPDFHLKSMEPGLLNHRTALVVNLQNSEAALAKNMRVLAQVFREGSDEVFRELRLDHAEMAPNSNGDYVVDWQGPLDRGDYSLYLRVEHEDNVWEWREPFRINGQDAGYVNSAALNASGRPVWLYAILGLAGFLLIARLAFRLGRRSRKTGD